MFNTNDDDIILNIKPHQKPAKTDPFRSERKVDINKEKYQKRFMKDQSRTSHKSFERPERNFSRNRDEGEKEKEKDKEKKAGEGERQYGNKPKRVARIITGNI